MTTSNAKVNARGHRIVEGYLFIRLKVAGGAKKSAWVRKTGKISYREYDKHGGKLNRVILAKAEDLIEVKPAVYNLHYDEMEIAEGN